MPTKNIDHEEILTFLEDNMSKLVRLKVASRAKYEQYDEAYMNCLTADSIDDEERKEMYGEEVELCYQQMLNKLQKALLDDKSLLDIDVIREFRDLMLP